MKRLVRAQDHHRRTTRHIQSRLWSAGLSPLRVSGVFSYKKNGGKTPGPIVHTTPVMSEPALSLLVPVAAWPTPPHHDVTALAVTSLARAAAVTGSASGQVCLWSVIESGSGSGDSTSLRLTPRVLLLGHAAPVVWVASCRFEKLEALVSLCRGGLLNVWDPMDGRCLSSAAAPVLPAATVGAVVPQLSHAIVGGESPTLSIIHLSTMTVRCTLAPLDDWCLALAVSSGADQLTRLICLDGAGTVRCWMLAIHAATGAVSVPAPPVCCTLPPPTPLEKSPEVAEADPEKMRMEAAAAAVAALSSPITRKTSYKTKKAMDNPWDEEAEVRRHTCDVPICTRRARAQLA